MITRPTVLILGAGASKPFDYPTGKELKIKICNNLDSWRDLFLSSGIVDQQVSLFKEQLERSPDSSVDAFVEFRPEFLAIGKLAIARALIPLENESNLYDDKPNKNNWLQYLFGKMSCNFEEFENNKLSIITFNYDRTVEQYFFNGLQNKYNKDNQEVSKKLINIPIVHLHGQLGYLPWQSKPDRLWRRYGENTNQRNSFREAAELVKIISENISPDTEFKQAHELIGKAEKIYILGFGYNDKNLERLNLNQYKKGREIVGSSLGLGDAERKEITTKWRFIKLPDSRYDVLGFFKNCAPLI